MTEAEVIKNINALNAVCGQKDFYDEKFVEALKMGVDALKKQSMVNEILNEAEQYKLALFGVIRNSKVMPVGLAQGRSMEEINAMSLKTMEEVLKMCDFDKMKQFYSEAEEALAKMGGKE